MNQTFIENQINDVTNKLSMLERIREAQRKANKKYRDSNPEKFREYSKKYYKANREKINESMRQQYLKSKTKKNETLTEINENKTI